MFESREAARFVGRERELALVADPRFSVIFVHGSAGIGKSSLLREAARRARKSGALVLEVDGRRRDAAPDALLAALDELAARLGPALLLLDTYEQVTALGELLRGRLEPLIAAGARVIIAGRRPPEAEWSIDGWEHVTLVRHLRPLADAAARALVMHHGLDDGAVARQIVDWAHGSPLALAVAADTIVAGNDVDLTALDIDALLGDTLLSRLAGEELDGANHEVLAIAAIARGVDARLLSATLPETDGDHAEAWLRSLSFSERLGTMVTLHERVRSAIREALKAQDANRERELRRRIADHLYLRAVREGMHVFSDLTELIGDPEVGWGLAPPPTRFRAGRPQPGDDAAVCRRLEGEGTKWWGSMQRWFDESPEHITIVRDRAGTVSGWSITVTPADAPPWAREDPVLARWLPLAQEIAPEGDVIVVREIGDLTEDGDEAAASPAGAALNYEIVTRYRTPWRHIVASIPATAERRKTHSRALGYVPRSEHDVVDAGRTLTCWVVDYGPGGVARAIRDMIYLDLGFQPPCAKSRGAVSAADVRDALRSFHDPVTLAGSRLAEGEGVEERATALRAVLCAALDRAFGESSDERLSRATIQRGYIDADGGHAIAILELNVGRATYFRRLALASARVAECLLIARDR